MKIVADESIDKQIVERLRTDGHEVLSIAELDPGIDDPTVLVLAREATAILLTADKDFGELVYRQRLLHTGVLLIRLAGITPEEKAEQVGRVFESLGGSLTQCFAVLSKSALRLRRVGS